MSLKRKSTHDDNNTSPKKPKQTPFQPASQPLKDSNGDTFWEISKARRVTISDFKGKKMVSVREYYEKDDDWLPGKKGISMTLEQFNVLVELLPSIEEELRKSGAENLARPSYGEVASSSKVTAREEVGRANHEATSDEEE